MPPGRNASTAARYRRLFRLSSPHPPLLTHSHDTSHTIPAHSQLGSGTLSSAVNAKACTSYFLNEAALESLDWVRSALKAHDDAAEAGAEGIEGKLICPNAKCGARLGNFNWSGSQCSCGSWVVPAIQVVARKVDRKGRRRQKGWWWWTLERSYGRGKSNKDRSSSSSSSEKKLRREREKHKKQRNDDRRETGEDAVVAQTVLEGVVIAAGGGGDC